MSTCSAGCVGEHGTALAHGDVVRGIKRDGGDVAEGARILAVQRGAESIAAIFNQPEIVLPREGGNGFRVEDISQRVGEDDGAGLRAEGGFELRDVNL